MARLEYHACPIVYASVLQRCLYNQLKLVDAISFFRGKIVTLGKNPAGFIPLFSALDFFVYRTTIIINKLWNQYNERFNRNKKETKSNRRK